MHRLSGHLDSRIVIGVDADAGLVGLFGVRVVMIALLAVGQRFEFV